MAKLRTSESVPRLRQKGRLPEHTAHWAGIGAPVADALFQLSRRVVTGEHGEPFTIPDEPRFADFALRQGLGAALRLLDGQDPRTTELREFGRRCYLDQLLRADGMIQAARQVLQAAEAAGVPLLFIKGPTVARSVYDDVGDRPYTDLDVWVQGEAEAHALVRAMGMTPYPNARSGLFFDIRRFKSTLNYRLPPIAGREYHLELHFLPDEPVTPEQMLIAESGGFDRPHQLGDLPTIPVGALIPYLTLHLVHSHLGARLVWYQDLALFRRRGLSTDDLAQVAHWGGRTRCLGMLAAMAERLEEYYGLPADPAWQAMTPARGSGRRRRLVRRLTSRQNILYDFGGGTTGYFRYRFRERTIANLTWLFSYNLLYDPDGAAAVMTLGDRSVDWSVRFAIHGTNLRRGTRAYRICRALMLPIAAYVLMPLAVLFGWFLDSYLKRQAR